MSQVGCGKNRHASRDTVLTKKDARLITASYTYDALHRETGVTYSNSDPALTFTYDESNCLSLSACQNLGHRTSMTDGAGSEKWAYQIDKPNSRSIHREQRTNNSSPSNITKTTTYYLDLAGNVTQIVYPTGRTVNYTADSADRPSSATDAANGITYATDWKTPPASTTCTATSVCYTPQGSVYSMSLGQTSSYNGFNISETFNNRLQPNEIKAGTALDITYSFVDPVSLKNAGHVYGIANNLNSSRSQSFTYDQLNRILTAKTISTTGTYCWGYQFSYDAWGNLNSQAGLTGYGSCTEYSSSATADVNNHLAGLSYDTSGNTLSDGNYSYTWDGESQMKTAAGVTYAYDGDGRRVAKVGSKLYWYGSGGEILSETDASGATLNDYIFFSGKRVADVPATGNVLFYAEDTLGSSRVIVQSNGTLCYDGDFTPFGGERSYTSTCAQNYKFEGKERDSETGNDDFGARYYSWRFGRWLSSDWSAVPVPVPYANLSNPQTLNLYAMVVDDPESFADLDGHICTDPAKGCATTTVDNSKTQASQGQGTSQTGQNTNATERITMGIEAAANLYVAKDKAEIALGLALSTPETGPAATAAATGAALASISSLSSALTGVAQMVGVITGKTKEAGELADGLAASTSVTGLITTVVTKGDVKKAAAAASIEGIATSSFRREIFKRGASVVETAVNIIDLVSAPPAPPRPPVPGPPPTQ
jgi:RHS repeat-associated protein